MRQIPVILVAIAVTLAGGMVLPALVTADATAEQTITTCTTISEPGTYTLGENLTETSGETCLQIESDDVVLDGAGHTLTGTGQYGDSVGVAVNASDDGSVDAYRNVTVRDVRFESWRAGVSLAETHNVTVSDVEVTDSRRGVRVGKSASRVGGSAPAPGNETTVRESTFVDNVQGVYVLAAEDVDVVDNDFRSGGIRTSLRSSLLTDVDIVRNDIDTGFARIGGSLEPEDDYNVSSDVTVRANTIESGGIDATATRNLTVENNTLRGVERSGSGIDLAYTRDSLVVNNSLTGLGSGAGIQLSSSSWASNITTTGNRIAGNLIRNYSSGVSFRLNANGNVVEGNTIVDNEIGVKFDSFEAVDDGEPNYVRGNDVTNNTDGIGVESAFVPIVVESNDLSGNEKGVHVLPTGVCAEGPEGAEVVSLRGNDLGDNAAYGVLNDNADTLNATGNYWGASDGPSSGDDADAPFADPVTGTLADGNGTAVSEDPDTSGESNVHFDPALDASPDDVGVQNETAA